MSLLTTYELCQKIEVSRRSIQRWYKAGSITPVHTNAPGNLWDWQQVQQWLVDTGRWDDVTNVLLRLIVTPEKWCIRDHELNGENLYIEPSGKKRCRECARIRKQKSRTDVQVIGEWLKKVGAA